MIPPQPKSTLFPYTTLFRSGGAPASPAYACEAADRVGNSAVEWNRLEKAFEDRKSTRLNSSHRCISYAVFCLKKKKKIKQKKNIINKLTSKLVVKNTT